MEFEILKRKIIKRWPFLQRKVKLVYATFDSDRRCLAVKINVCKKTENLSFFREIIIQNSSTNNEYYVCYGLNGSLVSLFIPKENIFKTLKGIL